VPKAVSSSRIPILLPFLLPPLFPRHEHRVIRRTVIRAPFLVAIIRWMLLTGSRARCMLIASVRRASGE